MNHAKRRGRAYSEAESHWKRGGFVFNPEYQQEMHYNYLQSCLHVRREFDPAADILIRAEDGQQWQMTKSWMDLWMLPLPLMKHPHHSSKSAATTLCPSSKDLSFYLLIQDPLAR
jgi:hypothetical protein